MKRNHQESRRCRQVIPIWSYAQAQSAVPYIASIMRSLREHRLTAQSQQVQAVRIAAQPGRPDRTAMIAHQEALRAVGRAEDCYEEALQELQGLGIYCQAPIRGLALLPFVHEQLLAWFVFDLFADEPLVCWRYHSDTVETQRPMHEVKDGTAPASR